VSKPGGDRVAIDICLGHMATLATSRCSFIRIDFVIKDGVPPLKIGHLFVKLRVRGRALLVKTLSNDCMTGGTHSRTQDVVAFSGSKTNMTLHGHRDRIGVRAIYLTLIVKLETACKRCVCTEIFTTDLMTNCARDSIFTKSSFRMVIA
jgi:hypothetical protein